MLRRNGQNNLILKLCYKYRLHLKKPDSILNEKKLLTSLKTVEDKIYRTVIDFYLNTKFLNTIIFYQLDY